MSINVCIIVQVLVDARLPTSCYAPTPHAYLQGKFVVTSELLYILFMGEDNAFINDDHESNKEVNISMIGDMALVPVTFYDKETNDEHETLGIQGEVPEFKAEMALNMRRINGFYPARNNTGEVSPATFVKTNGEGILIDLPFDSFTELYMVWSKERN